MRHATSVFFLLSLLLSSCQGPRVTVLVNDLKPGMLQGRTVGVGGMVATFAAWPGRPIPPEILAQAEQALQRRLKGTRVQALPADALAQATRAVAYDGRMQTSAALDATVARFSKAHADLADYFFMVFLRTDFTDHIKSDGTEFGTSYLMPSGRPGSRWTWRGITRHTLKADYLLYDSRTSQVVWRAKAVCADEDVSINDSHVGHHKAASRPDWVPATPTEQLWSQMNAFTASTLRKPGTSSHQARVIRGWHL